MIRGEEVLEKIQSRELSVADVVDIVMYAGCTPADALRETSYWTEVDAKIDATVKEMGDFLFYREDYGEADAQSIIDALISGGKDAADKALAKILDDFQRRALPQAYVDGMVCAFGALGYEVTIKDSGDD